MSLDFGDISGVEPREIHHEESDLEDEFFLPLDSFKKSKYVIFWGVYRGVRRIFSGGGQIFFVGGLSRFIGLRVHHNYGFMALGYFMPRK